MVTEDMRYLGTGLAIKIVNFGSSLSSILTCFHFIWHDIFSFKPHQFQWEKKKKEELCVKCLARFNFLPVSAEFLQHNEKIRNTSKGKETAQSHHHSMNQRDFVMWKYDHHHMRELLSTSMKYLCYPTTLTNSTYITFSSGIKKNRVLKKNPKPKSLRTSCFCLSQTVSVLMQHS